MRKEIKTFDNIEIKKYNFDPCKVIVVSENVGINNILLSHKI